MQSSTERGLAGVCTVRGMKKPMYEVYDIKTGKAVDVETDKNFEGSEVLFDLDGKGMLHDGYEIVKTFDDFLYGVRERKGDENA